jgi:hypothetical protein
LFVKPDDYAHSGEAVSTLLEALRRLGATEGAPPTKSLFESGSGAESALYGLLRDGLARLEREARRHAEFVDRLTTTPKAATEKGAAPYQETLYLQGAAGTRTAGRFRAINRRAARVSVATLSRPFRQNGEPAREGPTLTLRPGAFYLDPGEARVVIVEAELPGPGRYESCLDLTMDDAVALKLWIEIDVYS